MEAKTFEVYRTSAGAGKTFAIVREFIVLNLQNRSRFDQIAAMTFTNKAANEMKDRLLEYLFLIARYPDSKEDVKEMIHQLSAETGHPPKKISESATGLLSDILHQYARFSITTIDSFIHDILRIFSHDLRLPDNFSVETDTVAVADLIVDELIHELEYADNEPELIALTDYVVELSMQSFEEKDTWDISRELKRYAKLLFNEDAMQSIYKISRFSVGDFSAMAKRLQALEESVFQRIRMHASDAVNVFRNNSLTEDDFYRKGQGLAGFFVRLSEAKRGSRLTYNSWILETVENDKWEAGKNDKIPENIRTRLRELFYLIINDPMYQYMDFLIQLRFQVGSMALIGKLRRLLDEYQVNNQVLVISEFNRLISSVVQNEPAPFIYERLGQKFRHFLIDEFQDTSVMQWQNFLPLIENSLSQRNKVLVVGDVKQSIYRFRNGEMEQLMKLPLIYDKPAGISHFDDVENSMIHMFLDKTSLPEFKNTNYRSGEYIVRLNNSHFSWIGNLYKTTGANPFIAEAYQNPEQEFPDKAADSGLVNFYPLPREDYHDRTLQQILQIINSHPEKSDIAILTRGNASARMIASFLMQQNPPVSVISSESLTLSFSPHVCFIMDVLRLIYNSSDQIAMISVYTYLITYTDMLKDHYSDYSKWLNTEFFRLSDKERTNSFISLLKGAGIDLDIQLLSKKPVDELLSAVIKLLGRSEKADSYTLFFQNKCIDFIGKKGATLRSLIEWWDEKGHSESIIVPEGADAVRILSVHKSKGLQFPVVIYPFADFKLRETSKSVWVQTQLFPEEIKNAIQIPEIDKMQLKLSVSKNLPEGELKSRLDNEILKQELDSLNIHYVAMTRARHELHVLFRDANKQDDSDLKQASDISHLVNSFLVSNKHLFNQSIKASGAEVLSYGKPMSGNIISQKNNTIGIDLEYIISRDRSSIPPRGRGWEKSKAILTGDLFHLLMSEMDFAMEARQQFQNFCDKYAVNKEQVVILNSMLDSMLEHSRMRDLFTSNIQYLNEATIIAKDQIYRPDKIIFTKSSTYVIDFKTGKKQPWHEDQIRNYRSLIEKMKYPAPVSLLVYIRPEEVEVEEVL